MIGQLTGGPHLPAGYDRRKYVWKLLYIYMLGYPITFGHRQACDLIPMPKYKDKQVGYMACSILLNEVRSPVERGSPGVGG